MRVLNIAGRVITTGRRHLLRLPSGWPWADDVPAARHRLDILIA